MTVGELIKKLQKVDEDMPVFVATAGEDGEDFIIEIDEDGVACFLVGGIEETPSAGEYEKEIDCEYGGLIIVPWDFECGYCDECDFCPENSYTQKEDV